MNLSYFDKLCLLYTKDKSSEGLSRCELEAPGQTGDKALFSVAVILDLVGAKRLVIHEQHSDQQLHTVEETLFKYDRKRYAKGNREIVASVAEVVSTTPTGMRMADLFLSAVQESQQRAKQKGNEPNVEGYLNRIMDWITGIATWELGLEDLLQRGICKKTEKSGWIVKYVNYSVVDCAVAQRVWNDMIDVLEGREDGALATLIAAYYITERSFGFLGYDGSGPPEAFDADPDANFSIGHHKSQKPKTHYRLADTIYRSNTTARLIADAYYMVRRNIQDRVSDDSRG